MTDCKQCVHPVCRLTDLIILITSRVILSHSHNEVENRDERTDSIRITSEHQIAKADIIVRSDMTSRHPCERGLLGGECC
jgi:hypothetical protein